MRHRCHVLNLGDFDAQIVQRTNCRLTTRTWALDTHFQVLYTTFHRHFAGCFRSDLCSPDSPHSMLSPKAKSLALALDAANAARATGKGWGKGEIAHLVKPILPKTTA